MKVASASHILVTVMATAALALPVEQHPLVSTEIRQGGADVAPVAASQPSSADDAKTSPESNDVLSAWKSIFYPKKHEKEVSLLGGGCFCANGAICCNTTDGLDCTQGLCGL